MDGHTESTQPPLGIGTPTWFCWMGKESAEMDADQFERLSQSLARFSLFFVPRSTLEELQSHFDVLIQSWWDTANNLSAHRFNALLSELIKAHVVRAGLRFDRDTVRYFLNHEKSRFLVEDKTIGLVLWDSARRVGLQDEILENGTMPLPSNLDVRRN